MDTTETQATTPNPEYEWDVGNLTAPGPMGEAARRYALARVIVQIAADMEAALPPGVGSVSPEPPTDGRHDACIRHVYDIETFVPSMVAHDCVAELARAVAHGYTVFLTLELPKMVEASCRRTSARVCVRGVIVFDIRRDTFRVHVDAILRK